MRSHMRTHMCSHKRYPIALCTSFHTCQIHISLRGNSTRPIPCQHESNPYLKCVWFDNDAESLGVYPIRNVYLVRNNQCSIYILYRVHCFEVINIATIAIEVIYATFLLDKPNIGNNIDKVELNAIHLFFNYFLK